MEWFKEVCLEFPNPQQTYSCLASLHLPQCWGFCPGQTLTYQIDTWIKRQAKVTICVFLKHGKWCNLFYSFCSRAKFDLCTHSLPESWFKCTLKVTLFGQAFDNCRKIRQLCWVERWWCPAVPFRIHFISQRIKFSPVAPFTCHFSAVKSPSTESSLSIGRKRICHFKFSAGNWHFIIYVFHVIMLDNITNDAIRSTGNLKWCTPVLTWERSNSSYTTSPAENQQYTKPLHT